MLEHLNCPHGAGPVHLLIDLWWVFVLLIGSPFYYLVKGKLPKRKKCSHKDK